MMPAAFSETSCAKRKSTKTAQGVFSNLLITCLSRSALPDRWVGVRVEFVFSMAHGRARRDGPAQIPMLSWEFGRVGHCLYSFCFMLGLEAGTGVCCAWRTTHPSSSAAAGSAAAAAVDSVVRGPWSSRATTDGDAELQQDPGREPSRVALQGRRQFGGRRLEPG